MQKVSFQIDGLTIRGTLVMPNSTGKSFPGVIIFHGMASSENSYVPLAASLAETGIAGLAISMRGHGESEGDFHEATVGEAINDAIAAYDFMAGQDGIDPSRLGIVGASVGAILASMAMEQRAVKSLILRAPAAYTPQMMQISMADTMINDETQFHEIKDLASTPAGRAITNFQGSLLIVASEKDAIVPLRVPQGYLDLAAQSDKKRLIVIKGAPHILTGTQWKDTFNRAAVDWFRNTL